MDNNQDEICHETWNSFHGSSVQMKDIMSEKKSWMALPRYFSAMEKSDFDGIFWR